MTLLGLKEVQIFVLNKQIVALRAEIQRLTKESAPPGPTT